MTIMVSLSPAMLYLLATATRTVTSFRTMRTNHPSIVLLAGIASTSAWAPASGHYNSRRSAAAGCGVASSASASSTISRGNALHGSRGGSASATSLRAASSSAATTTMPPLSSGLHDEHHLPLARDAMRFIDDSPDPFHAVRSASDALENVGFVEWNEDDDDQLAPGGKYYFTRNRSTLVAFAIGSNYAPGSGFKIIGSHTDSPNLKVKPYSKRTTAKGGGSSGAIQLAVECYGGGLWHTWFDRDLGVSGRVFVRDDESGRIRQVRERESSRDSTRQHTLQLHAAHKSSVCRL